MTSRSEQPTLTELVLMRLNVKLEDVRELRADLLTVAKIARREPLEVLRAILAPKGAAR